MDMMEKAVGNERGDVNVNVSSMGLKSHRRL